MGAATHVDVFFVVIETRLIIFADVAIQDLHLVGFAARFKRVAGFLPGNYLLHHVIAGFGQLQHALFQRCHIFVGEFVVQIHVVVKAVFDSGADGHFHIWPQLA